MAQKFIPSLLIPEIYFPMKEKKNFTVDIIEELSEEGFYRSFEIGDGQDKAERKRILDIATTEKYEITQWLTFLIDREGLDVSTIDTELRKRTVKRMVESLYKAAETGASNIAFVTGDDPGVNKRKDAMEGLYESLCEISEEAVKYNMNVLVEPLDRFAHKKRLIGPTDETFALINRVKKYYSNVGIAFDTAHAALNGEDINEALEMAKDYVQQIHFSNAVLDEASELYGDYHMAIGDPGFLNPNRINSILQKIVELNILGDRGFRVAMEVRGNDEANYRDNERVTRKILGNALNQFKNN